MSVNSAFYSFHIQYNIIYSIYIYMYIRIYMFDRYVRRRAKAASRVC